MWARPGAGCLGSTREVFDYLDLRLVRNGVLCRRHRCDVGIERHASHIQILIHRISNVPAGILGIEAEWRRRLRLRLREPDRAKVRVAEKLIEKEKDPRVGVSIRRRA
jgi:hypothetical protein